MFYKLQNELKDKPDLLALINCPIEIPKEPEPIPEPKVIDYWLKFQTLEKEEIFIELSGRNFEDYKKKVNYIRRRIDDLLKCLERDSEEGI